MKYDFDKVPDRRGTGSYKWDTDEGDVVPLWVADMDFETAPAVKEALARRVSHGVFGYVKVPDKYYDALTGWFSRRHGWDIERKSVIYTTGVVPAISAIIKGLCNPGDGVIVMTPVYNCFFSSIRNNGCRIVENPLKRIELDDGFTYEIDFENLERVASDDNNRMLLLCNPHNPAGRVWRREELERVAEICRRHGVKVVSDEIHCELTMPGYEYVPYGTVDSTGIICVSPSKAFNTAGLQIANIIIESDGDRRAVDRAININEVCDVNPFGVAGLIAAYNEGEGWLEALITYIWGNYEYLKEYFATELPDLRVSLLEGTYLAWIDIRPLGTGSEELEQMGVERAGVRVNSGIMYGVDGYIRINLACPRRRLEEGLRRFRTLVKSLQDSSGD